MMTIYFKHFSIASGCVHVYMCTCSMYPSMLEFGGLEEQRRERERVLKKNKRLSYVKGF